MEYAELLGCHAELFSIVERVAISTQHKLAFIAAILHQPKVLLLDEPWQFLDWSAQAAVSKVICDLQEAGCTILIASNDLHRLDDITKQFMVLDEGKMLASGTVTELSNVVRAKSKSLPEVWIAMEKLGQLRD